MLRNYGNSSKYINDVLGFNSRLDELQAGFLRLKLPSLDSDNDHRRSVAKRYLSEIKNDKVSLPQWNGTNNHVFHLFVIRVSNRNHLMSYLEELGIGTLIHYPVPPHQQKALPELEGLSFPVCEEIHREVVSIPMCPIMTDDEVTAVIEALNAY
jgi:dTDP-4-amino-4,6-dideoxygalactose transaminase